MGSLDTRVALVTGAGRGIGRAVAISLAAAGADVAVAARTGAQLEETAAAVRAEGRSCLTLVCDVGNRAQVDGVVARVREQMGPPLVLVNNAGIASSAKLTETSDELWDRTLRVNATGAFYCSRAVLPLQLEAGWGRIINMASVAARAGAAYISAYAASKHALLGLTRAVAAEVAGKGITVNAICPGYVDTDMTDRSVEFISTRTGRTPDQSRKVLEGFSPQNRLITAEEVAALAAYLCSDAARGINGQAIVVDGGAVQG